MPCDDRCDGVSCVFEPPAPPLPTHLASLLREPESKLAKANGNCDDEAGIDCAARRWTIDDVDLHLARFLSSLPSCWCSRQRVAAVRPRSSSCSSSSFSRPLLLCESVILARGARILSEEGGRRKTELLSSPTLALVVVVDGEEEEEFPSSFSSEGDDNFQVLAAFRSRGLDDLERRAERLASRLGCDGGAKAWSWRPLAPATTTAAADDDVGVVVCQLFSSSSTSSSSFLVATDYDYTLIDDNSDTRVVDALGASDVLRELHEVEKLEWTEAVDGALAAGAARAFEEKKKDAEEVVLSAAASAPCAPALRDAIRAVCCCGKNDLAVFSDANDVFIEHGLRGNGLDDVGVVAVATNPARFVDVASDPSSPQRGTYRRLALSRATTRYGDHGCNRCPSNLCKGELLAKLLVCSPRAPYNRGVAYLGDGSNDVCPASRCLGPLDVALAREMYGSNGKKAAFGTAVLPSSSPASSTAAAKKVQLLCRSVVGWSTQDELAEALLREERKRGVVVK